MQREERLRIGHQVSAGASTQPMIIFNHEIKLRRSATYTGTIKHYGKQDIHKKVSA